MNPVKTMIDMMNKNHSRCKGGLYGNCRMTTRSLMTDDKHNASRELIEMETRRRETLGIGGISAIWSGRLI
jgi:hypothetical protein